MMRDVTSTETQAVEFSKMAGGGNDFVMIDNRRGVISDAPRVAERICTRRLSAGADGLILIESSNRATFRMRYLNRDGSETDFCANGTRCAARFAFLNVIAPRKMTIETPAGVMGAEIHDQQVLLSLPSPRAFRPERPLQVGPMTVHGSSILVGVPHYVIYLQRDLWKQDIEPIGRKIRYHPDLVPDGGANVNFVVVEDEHSIALRTYERGVEEETLSCGSGVIASVSVSALFGRVSSPVDVKTRSGIRYEVTFDLDGQTLQNVKLRGDARLVYKAALTPETLEGFDPDWVRNPTDEEPART